MKIRREAESFRLLPIPKLPKKKPTTRSESRRVKGMSRVTITVNWAGEGCLSSSATNKLQLTDLPSSRRNYSCARR